MDGDTQPLTKLAFCSLPERVQIARLAQQLLRFYVHMTNPGEQQFRHARDIVVRYTGGKGSKRRTQLALTELQHQLSIKTARDEMRGRGRELDPLLAAKECRYASVHSRVEAAVAQEILCTFPWLLDHSFRSDLSRALMISIGALPSYEWWFPDRREIHHTVTVRPSWRRERASAPPQPPGCVTLGVTGDGPHRLVTYLAQGPGLRLTCRTVVVEC